MKSILYKPDGVGILASTLCSLHCLATPLLFMAHTTVMNEGGAAPMWWKSLDFLFLGVSFFAVYRSTRTTSNNFVKSALWIGWVALFTLIVNEKIKFTHLPEILMYAVAFTLAALHLYNLNYCQCKTDKCPTCNG